MQLPLASVDGATRRSATLQRAWATDIRRIGLRLALSCQPIQQAVAHAARDLVMLPRGQDIQAAAQWQWGDSGATPRTR